MLLGCCWAGAKLETALNAERMERPSGPLLPSHSVCSERSRSPSSHSSSPAKPMRSTSLAAITGAGPYSEVGTTPPLRLKPDSGEPPPIEPTSRFSQPSRASEPGAASSTSSMAAKCERLGAGSPVPWTTASSPDSQSGMSGASPGWKPKVPLRPTSESAGTPMRGRAW